MNGYSPELQELVRKRKKVLTDAQKAQDAYWVMLENNNFQQIAEMFEVSNRSLKKLGEIDLHITALIKTADTAQIDHIRPDLDHQEEMLIIIIKKEKEIHQSLQQNKMKIARSLEQSRNQLIFTKAYSKGLGKEKDNWLDKKI